MKLSSRLLALGFVLAALTTTSSSQAAAVILQNPSFELDSVPTDGGATSVITGWVKSGSGNDSNTLNPPANDTQPQSGSQTYLGTNFFPTSIGQFIFQQDLIQVQPNTKYTLSLYVGGRTAASGGLGYGGYVAQIGVGNLGKNTEETNPSDPSFGNFRTLAVSNGAGTGASDKPFEFITFSFTTPADLTNTTVRNPNPGQPSAFDETFGTSQADITGQYLRVGVGMPLTLASGQMNLTQSLLDSVAFDATAVPEPSTYALLGISLVGGWIAFRRRKFAA